MPSERDIENNSPSSRSSSLVPNTGSAARDYCTIERTLLSFTRLGLVLFMLSTSLLLKARIPNPDDSTDSGNSGSPASFPLGTIYTAASILAIVAGWLGYESDLKGLLEERGFVGGFKFSEAIVIAVALLLFATCIVLLQAEYSVQ
ncbi:transmembrane protein [Ceratobasidium sp. AG-Ba]|nr:transmembrane protein [Ceratobasidium sp. AG-Ba]